MKVIHLDEREARWVLEGCRAAQKLMDAAETLVGRTSNHWESERNLRYAIQVLERELGPDPDPESESSA